MDDLIVKYLLGAADADETTRIERWSAADERNKGRLRQFKTLWDISGRTKVSERPDTQEALGRLRSRIGWMEGSGDGIVAGRRIGEPRDVVGARRGPERIMLRKGLVAAVLVGLLCVGVVIFVVERRSGNSGVTKGGAERATERTAGGGGAAIVGVTVTVPGKDTLPDGSVVTLAPHSKFIYTPGLTGNSRTISLEGDATFRLFMIPRDLLLCWRGISLSGYWERHSWSEADPTVPR
jgi:hypothetical protein